MATGDPPWNLPPPGAHARKVKPDRRHDLSTALLGSELTLWAVVLLIGIVSALVRAWLA